MAAQAVAFYKVPYGYGGGAVNTDVVDFDIELEDSCMLSDSGPPPPVGATVAPFGTLALLTCRRFCALSDL